MHERCTLSGLLVAARHCSRNRFPPHAAMGLHGLQCGALSLEARAASASTSSAGDDRRKNPKPFGAAGPQGRSRSFSAGQQRSFSVRSSKSNSSGDAPLSAGSFGGFPGFSGSIRHKKRHGLFMFAGTVACSAALSSSAASAEAAEPAKGAKGGLPQGLGGMRLVSGSCMMPRPDKVKTGGEDAFFIAPDGTAVGVADGVGGWGDVGVDPAQHSRLLMANCRSYCEALANDIRLEEAGTAQPPMEVPRPADGEAADGAAAEPQPKKMFHRVLDVLVNANARTRVMGSSTACFVFLRGATLHGCNLGDSGFMVIRQGKVFFKSPQQQHAFNFPYQLGSQESDSPYSADLYDVPVQKGDIVLLATDGTWDNLFDDEICRIVDQEMSRSGSPQAAAERVANAAQIRGADTRTMTPFAVSAMKNRLVYRGGKQDDVTVVVAVVSDAPGAGGEAAERRSKL